MNTITCTEVVGTTSSPPWRYLYCGQPAVVLLLASINGHEYMGYAGCADHPQTIPEHWITVPLVNGVAS